jgi:hypothetical protein
MEFVISFIFIMFPKFITYKLRTVTCSKTSFIYQHDTYLLIHEQGLNIIYHKLPKDIQSTKLGVTF